MWRIRIACWIPKDINTPSEYVILFYFPLQFWAQEGSSILSYSVRILPVLWANLGIDRFAHHKPKSHKTQSHPTMIIKNLDSVYGYL